MDQSMCGAQARLLGITTLLLGAALAPAPLLRARYGHSAARRFTVGAGGTILLQQALVGTAISRARAGRPHRLTLVDLMTLSRGGAAAILAGLVSSGARDRQGPAGWTGWLAVLYGAILCDWLDGPIARHRGTSRLGAVLDLEMDSWLTLVTGVAATRWGGTGRAVAGPPLLRYLLTAMALRSMPYERLHGDEPAWVRRMGIVQMLLFIAALAPFGGRLTRFAVRVVGPMQTPLQVAGLLALHHRRKRL